MQRNRKIIVVYLGILLLIGCSCAKQADETKISISQEGATYVFKVSPKEKVLTEIEKEITPIDGADTTAQKGRITITLVDKNKVRVTLKDTVTAELANGKTIDFEEVRSIVCSTDFSKESIEPDSAEAVLGKADKYYTEITEKWLPASKLKALYDQGEVVKQRLQYLDTLSINKQNELK